MLFWLWTLSSKQRSATHKCVENKVKPPWLLWLNTRPSLWINFYQKEKSHTALPVAYMQNSRIIWFWQETCQRIVVFFRAIVEHTVYIATMHVILPFPNGIRQSYYVRYCYFGGAIRCLLVINYKFSIANSSAKLNDYLLFVSQHPLHCRNLAEMTSRWEMRRRCRIYESASVS